MKLKGFKLKVAYAKALIAKVERDLGHKLTDHKIDLLCDNGVCDTWEKATWVMAEVDPVYTMRFMAHTFRETRCALPVSLAENIGSNFTYPNS